MKKILVYVAGGIGLLWLISKLKKTNIEVGITDTTVSALGLAAPEDLLSLNLTLSGVRVHASNAPEQNWMSISESPKAIDLFPGTTQLPQILGSTTLPVGNYTQIRFQVDSASVTLKDGSTYPLSIPSREVKIVGGFDIQDGYMLSLTLDMNSGASVNESNGSYELRPTVHVTTEQIPIPEPIV